MGPDLLLWSNKNYRYRLGGTRYDPSHVDWHTYLNKYCLNPDPANEYMDNNISSFIAMANGSDGRLNESLVPRIVPSSNLTLGWDGPWTFSDIMQTNFEESWMDSTGNLHVLCLSTHSAQICMDCATFDRFGLVNQEIEFFEAKKIKKNCFDNLV